MGEQEFENKVRPGVKNPEVPAPPAPPAPPVEIATPIEKITWSEIEEAEDTWDDKKSSGLRHRYPLVPRIRARLVWLEEKIVEALRFTENMGSCLTMEYPVFYDLQGRVEEFYRIVRKSRGSDLYPIVKDLWDKIKENLMWNPPEMVELCEKKGLENFKPEIRRRLLDSLEYIVLYLDRYFR